MVVMERAFWLILFMRIIEMVLMCYRKFFMLMGQEDFVFQY